MKEHDAIITGAGSGIGRAVALDLAKNAQPIRLLLVGRTEKKLKQTAAMISDISSASVHVYSIDLNQLGAGKLIAEKASNLLGDIDAIFHVAGDAPMKSIDKYTGQEIDRCLRVNLGVGIEIVANIWNHLKQHPRSFVGFVSSMASVDPFPGFSLYAAAKVGVNMFIKCVAEQGAEHGIRSLAVAPGAVETPMLRSLFDQDTIPKDQTLSPQQVASVLVEAYLEKREFTSGQTIMMPS